MEDFAVTLKLLSEILLKKKEALITVLNICENEETVFLHGNICDSDILREMALQKQKYIDIVLDADNIFTNVFERIHDEMEEKCVKFPAEFSRVKHLINEVCELDVKIRLREEKNKNRLLGVKTAFQPAVPIIKVAGIYAKSGAAQNELT